MDARKNWTAQQDKLRKALSSRAHFDEAINLFLCQHAAVHCAEISGGQVWSLHDEVLAGLIPKEVEQTLEMIRRIKESLVTLVEDREEYFVLAGVVVVERAALHRHPPGDLPDRGRGVSLRGNELLRGPLDLALRLVQGVLTPGAPPGTSFAHGRSQGAFVRVRA